MENPQMGNSSPDPNDIIDLFNRLFKETYRTTLDQSEGDPLYVPMTHGQAFNRLLFRKNSFQSALHEIAHWCIAGEKRRTLPDYGYWYHPEGRTAKKQRAFFAVEAKPQALEWIFTSATHLPFFASLDNLSGQHVEPAEFKQSIQFEALKLLNHGLPKRGEVFCQSLIEHFKSHESFRVKCQKIKVHTLMPL